MATASPTATPAPAPVPVPAPTPAPTATATPPSSHTGLTEEQKKALAEARSGLPAENKSDDFEVLRFLRAHKWEVAKAVNGIVKYYEWRAEHKVDRLLDGPPPRGELLRRCVASAFHGYDKEGRPIYIEKTGSIGADVMLSTFTDDEIFWGHIWGQEMQSRRAREQSAKLGRNIETFTTIMDLTGLNGSHKKCLKFTKLMSEADAQYYPERLGRIYVINAPWIFPVLFGVIRRWLDPVTAAKIVVVKGDPKPVLAEFVALDNLPSEYGGTCATCPLAPDCVKIYDIGEFQKSMVKDDSETEFLTHTVAARAKWELKLEGGAGATFTWYFKTAAHDINFSVEFEPRAGKKRILNNPARLACATIPVQGEHISREAGTVILIFDNAFSYFTAKTLQYVTTVTEGVTTAGTATATATATPSAEGKEESKTAATTATAAATPPAAEGAGATAGAGAGAAASAEAAPSTPAPTPTPTPTPAAE